MSASPLKHRFRKLLLEGTCLRLKRGSCRSRLRSPERSRLPQAADRRLAGHVREGSIAALSRKSAFAADTFGSCGGLLRQATRHLRYRGNVRTSMHPLSGLAADLMGYLRDRDV